MYLKPLTGSESDEMKRLLFEAKREIGMERVLYFDIDGVLLDYNDHPKTALKDGKLEMEIKRCRFVQLCCVSGWSDMVQHRSFSYNPEQQKMALYSIVADVFPDKHWFLSSLRLVSNTDERCASIDLDSDWYYMDDWADEFFVKQYGRRQYESLVNNRVLLVDPYGDGSDILEWLASIN